MATPVTIRRYAPVAMIALAGALATLAMAQIGWRSSAIVLAGIIATVAVAVRLLPRRDPALPVDRAARMALEVLTQRTGRLSEGVLTIGEHAPRVSINASLADLWKLPAENADDPEALLASVFGSVKDPDALRADIARLEREPGAMIRHDVDLLDGRIFDVHAMSIQAEPNAPGGRRAYFVFNDISVQAGLERKWQFANALMQAQLDASPLGILVVDDAGIVAAHNRRFVEIAKVPGIVDATDDDRSAVELFAAQAKDPGAFVARVRYLYAHPDESSDDEISMSDGRVLQRHTVHLRSDGTSFGRVWFFADITDLRTSERTATEERDFVNALLDSLPGYFVLIDAGGRLVRWNESLRLLNGLTDAQLAGANPFANVVADDEAKTLNTVREAIDTGVALVEFRIQSQHGVRDLRWQGRRIMVDGQPHVLAIGVDVTDVYAAEAVRRAEEKRFRDIFESATEGIVIQDSVTGAFIDANPQMLHLFGYTRAEFLALDPLRISAAAPADVLARRASLVAETLSEAISFEWLCRAKDGHEFWCEFSSRHITDYGGRDVMLAMVRDISERRAALEAVRYRDRILHALTVGTAELVKAASLAGSMATLLKAVGEEIGVDRILVIQRSGLQNTAAGAAIAYGWEREGVPHIDFATVTFSYAEPEQRKAIEAWFAPLLRGLPVTSYASSATGVVRDILQSGSTVSNLQLPILVDGAYWGHFGVDDTHAVRDWSTIEIDALTTLSGIVGAMIARNQIVTARNEASAAVGHMATHDLLTDLPNRRFFIDALNAAIARSKRSGRIFAVLYLDLDRFKDVNDTLGHPGGDQLLQAVAARLLANVRAADVVSRFGGDEFAAIQIDIRDPADAATLAAKIVSILAEPFEIDGNEIRSGASIGIAVYGTDSPDAEALLAHADVALYRAKADGRNGYRFYTESMDAAVRERVTLERELRTALTLGQFFLVYQPQVDFTDGRIVGVEALVRWQHPARGVVMPESFIPAAEKSGFIVALGAWVFREACRQARSWIDDGIAPPVVAVNLSALQFKAPQDLEHTITAALAEFGVPATHIELELTESVMMQATQQHRDVLDRLRLMGFRMAIDDFGTGYSSLEYLQRIHVDRIKIPQIFIRDLGLVPESTTIVRATIGLAHELGITVVAEAVETRTQLDVLRGLGCRIIQGYYYSKPLSATDAGKALRIGVLGPKMLAAGVARRKLQTTSRSRPTIAGPP